MRACICMWWWCGGQSSADICQAGKARLQPLRCCCSPPPLPPPRAPPAHPPARSVVSCRKWARARPAMPATLVNITRTAPSPKVATTAPGSRAHTTLVAGAVAKPLENIGAWKSSGSQILRSPHCDAVRKRRLEIWISDPPARLPPPAADPASDPISPAAAASEVEGSGSESGCHATQRRGQCSARSRSTSPEEPPACICMGRGQCVSNPM